MYSGHAVSAISPFARPLDRAEGGPPASPRAVQPSDRSNRDVVRGTLMGLASPLVVDLGGRNVAMAEQFLDVADVLAVVEQDGGGSGPQGVGRVQAAPAGCAVGQLLLLHGARE